MVPLWPQFRYANTLQKNPKQNKQNTSKLRKFLLLLSKGISWYTISPQDSHILSNIQSAQQLPSVSPSWIHGIKRIPVSGMRSLLNPLVAKQWRVHQEENIRLKWWKTMKLKWGSAYSASSAMALQQYGLRRGSWAEIQHEEQSVHEKKQTICKIT